MENAGRWVNHRCSGYNCHVHAKWVEGTEAERAGGGRWPGGGWQLWFVAETDIPPGTELTITYGAAYWDDGRVCSCGAPDCVSNNMNNKKRKMSK